MRRLRARDQSGMASLLVLLISVMLLFLGGISLDLWRAFSDRRAVASMADAAAVAGASQVDQDAFRGSCRPPNSPASPGCGKVVLKRDLAYNTARDALESEPGYDKPTMPSDIQILPDAAGDYVTVQVTIHATVQLTLLRIIEPFTSGPNDPLQFDTVGEASVEASR